jgi:hypothetical protein
LDEWKNMGKTVQSKVQEIIFGSSEKGESKDITAQLRDNLIRKIAPKIYTTNLTDQPSAIVKRNWFWILAHQYSDGLLSHRSALEFKPTPGGHIFLTHSYSKNISLPGLHIHLIKGPTKIEGDTIFFENLHASQEARAFLENLQQVRTKGEQSKCLTQIEVEDKLEAIIRARGEKGINALRDRAKAIAPLLKMEREFIKLNQLISNMLASGDSKTLTSLVARARAMGEPVDPGRIKLFEILYEALAGQLFPEHKLKSSTDSAYKTFGFFESYFSNYIEGTEFTVDEAREIIGTNLPMATRDEDSHDILGTYRIVANQEEMSICPTNPNEFLDIMRKRHAMLLQSRTTKKPGEFKDKNNRAGNTEFVNHELVNGTLKRGFEWYRLLREPFAKAIYMMFLVSEVHPFLDGNGRIARVMMNAELSSKGLVKIIIPTVYREDYMGALRKLTRRHLPDPYIRMMLRAHHFSAKLYHEDIDPMEKYLIDCNAFMEPGEGLLKVL